MTACNRSRTHRFQRTGSLGIALFVVLLLVSGHSSFAHAAAGASSVGVEFEVGPRTMDATIGVRTELPLGARAVDLHVAHTFTGKQESPDTFKGELQLLHVSSPLRVFDTPVHLGIGKAAHRLGRGRLDTLLSSGELPGYPSLAYRILGERYTYTKVLGDLDYNDGYRRLGVHYVDYVPTPTLSIGAGEVYVRSQPFAGDIFYDMVPVLPYYFHKYLPGVKSGPGNNLIYGDAELRTEHAVFYGELLVNEFPALLGLTSNPALYNVLLGAEFGPIVAEYARLTNYAYSNGDAKSVYAYRGKGLGHALETDGDVLNVRWLHALTPRLDIIVGGMLKRRGEGEVDDWFSSPAEREANAFLSGTPERTFAAVAGVEYSLDRWNAHLEIKAGPVQNKDHVAGKTGFFYELRYGVSVKTF